MVSGCRMILFCWERLQIRIRTTGSVTCMYMPPALREKALLFRKPRPLDVLFLSRIAAATESRLTMVLTEFFAEQVTDGVDGAMCALSAEAVSQKIIDLLSDNEKRHQYGERAAVSRINNEVDIRKVFELQSEKG